MSDTCCGEETSANQDYAWSYKPACSSLSTYLLLASVIFLCTCQKFLLFPTLINIVNMARLLGSTLCIKKKKKIKWHSEHRLRFCYSLESTQSASVRDIYKHADFISILKSICRKTVLAALSVPFLWDNWMGICSKNKRRCTQNCAWDPVLYANAADATAVSQEKAASTCGGLGRVSSQHIHQVWIRAAINALKLLCLFSVCFFPPYSSKYSVKSFITGYGKHSWW